MVAAQRPNMWSKFQVHLQHTCTGNWFGVHIFIEEKKFSFRFTRGSSFLLSGHSRGSMRRVCEGNKRKDFFSKIKKEAGFAFNKGTPRIVKVPYRLLRYLMLKKFGVSKTEYHLELYKHKILCGRWQHQ